MSVVTTTDSVVNTATPGVIYIQTAGRHKLLDAFPRLFCILARRRAQFSIIHCPTFGHLSGLAVLTGRILRRPTLLRVATQHDVREFAEFLGQCGGFKIW